MRRTLIINDIHGELKLLNKLLKKVKYTADKDQLILLGDYIDRGPDSKGVLERVMELREQGAIVLKGNHDDMMVSAVDNKPDAWKRWQRAGALSTLQSYDSSINSTMLPETDEFKNHVSLSEQWIIFTNRITTYSFMQVSDRIFCLKKMNVIHFYGFENYFMRSMQIIKRLSSVIHRSLLFVRKKITTSILVITI